MRSDYFSYWEKDAWFNDLDLVIVGSGIVGLSSALFIQQKYPSWRIRVLESGILPHGATTRNAGFACFGSVGEVLADIRSVGKDQAYALVRQRYQGLQALLHLHDKAEIGFESWGGYELFLEGEEETYAACCDQLDELNGELADVLGVKEPVYRIANAAETASQGLSRVQGAFFTPLEGQLHSGKLMFSLLRRAERAGIRIINGVHVAGYTASDHQVLLHTDQAGEICARRLLITNNGFAARLLPELDVKPARGQVLVTSAVPGLALRGTFHHNTGYDYFRNIGDRVLIGGGRDLDMQVEETTEMSGNERIEHYLHQLLHEVILPGKNFTIEHQWAGIMGVGEVKSPIIRAITDRVMVAVRMGGMGVAIGTNVGQEAAGLMHD